MDTTESSRAVSPVVGVILVVAITVALSGVVGVFVFDLGQSVSDSQTSGDIATRTTYNDDGTADIQVVTGEADELRVLVNGTESPFALTDAEPGETLTVSATENSTLTIISTSNGRDTVLTTSNTGATAPTTPAVGLIAHYTFNDGTATDSAGTYDADVYGASFTDDPERGLVTTLDNSTEDYLVLNTSQTTAPMTVSLWVKKDTTNSPQFVFDQGGTRFYIAYEYRNANGFETGIYDGSAYTTLTSGGAAGEWTHLVATYDGTTLTFYQNASSAGSAVVSQIDQTKTHQELGRRTAGNYLSGSIDDVRIYDLALTDQEVNDLYNSTK